MPDDPIRRVLALGDVHAEDETLEAALCSRLAAGADLVVAVGDVVDGPGDADRTVDLLDRHGVAVVRGNHERWLLAGQMRHLPEATQAIRPETRRFLERLPTNLELETVAGRLLVSHGVGLDDEAELRPDTAGYGLVAALATVRSRHDVRYFLGGHTHEPMVRRLDEQVFVNAGTLHRKADPPVVLWLDFEARRAELHAAQPHRAPGPVVARWSL